MSPAATDLQATSFRPTHPCSQWSDSNNKQLSSPVNELQLLILVDKEQWLASRPTWPPDHHVDRVETLTGCNGFVDLRLFGFERQLTNHGIPLCSFQGFQPQYLSRVPHDSTSFFLFATDDQPVLKISCINTPLEPKDLKILAPIGTRAHDGPVRMTMPQYTSFAVPKEGVSKEVLEADLPYYLGRDAKLVDSHKADRYIIQTLQEPPRSMITSLRDDTSRWRKSDDYYRRKREIHQPRGFIMLTETAYSESRIHQDRKRASRDQHDAHRITGVAPIAVPSRPPLAQRYSSSSGSVFGSMQGSPGSNYESISRTQSRRESDATDGGMISRTMSASSVSSDYGTTGSYGFNNDPAYGTTGGYGFANAHRGAPAYFSRP